MRHHAPWKGRMSAAQEGMKTRERTDADRDTQIKHERSDMNDGDDRHRLQMAEDDANDSQALTGGDITRYRALVSRFFYLSQDRPDLKFA